MSFIRNRLERKFEMYQRKVQAGFRKEYYTSENLLMITQLIEKSIKYSIQLWIAFKDFKKAFDSLQPYGVINSMKNARTDQRYIYRMKHIYYIPQ